MRRLLQSFKFLIALLVLVGAFYWFVLKPMPVQTHVIEQGAITAAIMGTGTLEAHIKATISPKISGRLTAVHVDQGHRVIKGQLLAALDDVDLRQQVEVAQAGISAAHASLDLVVADKRRTEAILEQARRDYQRSQNLTSAQVSTSEEFEKASEALAVAEAGVERAEAAIVESHKQILTAERTLAYHQARLTDTRLEAPFDGLIVKRHRDPGDVAVPGSAVLSLIATDVIWVSAWVDETEMVRLASGQKAEVVFRSEPDHVYQGEVLRLGREADRETREFVVDVQVLSLPEVWAVGQRAEVYIETDHKEICTVLPQTLILWKEGQPGVFMEADGKATWRPLSLGLKGKTMVEILEGASPGDGVITPLLPKTSSLAEGRRVKMP